MQGGTFKMNIILIPHFVDGDGQRSLINGNWAHWVFIIGVASCQGDCSCLEKAKQISERRSVYKGQPGYRRVLVREVITDSYSTGLGRSLDLITSI